MKKCINNIFIFAPRMASTILQTICMFFFISMIGLFLLKPAHCASVLATAYGGDSGLGGSCDGDVQPSNPRSGDGLIAIDSSSCDWQNYRGYPIDGNFSGTSSAAAYGSDTSWHGIAIHAFEGLSVEPMADVQANVSATGSDTCWCGSSNASADITVSHRLRERDGNPLPSDLPNLFEILNNIPVKVAYNLTAQVDGAGQSGALLEILELGIYRHIDSGSDSGVLSFIMSADTIFSIRASSGVTVSACLEGCATSPSNSSGQAIADPFAHVDPDWEYAEHFAVEQESTLNIGEWAEVTRKWQTFCEANFDPDSDVDGKDFAVFLIDFGKINCDGECMSDFDEDGDVDVNDLQFLIADFGKLNCNDFLKRI